ncbi:(2Fe-2S) ferredoxin domain-containing protein [Leptolyngbya iicbica]|uniref:(2Fe-2S) ferredoxin domain-containing protein n=1 Tax=Leptolyngbya iicbica TaxID=3161580 RepID=UPI001911F2F2|nr:(2Fe-2S) ferredoxin domain-containing protein [Leptolyngbya sp. LK]
MSDRPVADVAQRQVLVCQHKTCLKDGAAPVLQAGQGQQTPIMATVIASGCLGNCGNGPSVLVLPEQTLYSHVRSQELAAILSRHRQELPTSRSPSESSPQPPASRAERRVAIIGLSIAVLLIMGCLAWMLYSLV